VSRSRGRRRSRVHRHPVHVCHDDFRGVLAALRLRNESLTLKYIDLLPDPVLISNIIRKRLFVGRVDGMENMGV
jgi:hypothetical protein